VLEPDTDATCLHAEAEVPWVCIERACVTSIDNLYFGELAFGESDLAEAANSVAVDEVPEGTRLDLEQRDRIGVTGNRTRASARSRLGS
jgi:hypothetical protein